MTSEKLMISLESSTKLKSTVDLPVRSEAGVKYLQESDSKMMETPYTLANHLWRWYQDGYRGCAFNKVAAAMAERDNFNWQVPVEYASIEEIVGGEAGRRVLMNFDSLIDDGKNEGLVSYMFPAIQKPQELAKLITFLGKHDRFKILPDFNYAEFEYGGEPTRFVGIPFRIAVGQTHSGETAWAWPMIYNPWSFTTPARRFPESVHITFNRFNKKENPTTPPTMVGVDDIAHPKIAPIFKALMKTTMAVREKAHKDEQGGEFDRKILFRARHALVLPADIWESVQNETIT